MWSPQTILPVGPGKSDYDTHFAAYGLGWFLNDVGGYKNKMVSRTGGEIGMVTKVMRVPELHLGIIVLTHQEDNQIFETVSAHILNHYWGVAGKDRVREMTGYEKKSANEWDKVVAAAQKAAPQSPDYRAYVGRYHGVWRASCCSQSPVSRPKTGLCMGARLQNCWLGTKKPCPKRTGFFKV